MLETVDYLTLKTIHVIGAVLMVGNVTVTGVWALLMYRARHQASFRPAARAILWTDLFFTLGGGALLTVSGLWMVRLGRMPLLGTSWLRLGVGLLAASTLIWLVFLLPDQWRLERVDPADEARLRKLFVRWSAIGWTTTVLLYVAVWAMVHKPV